MKRGEQYPDLELTIDAVGKKASENISFYFRNKATINQITFHLIYYSFAQFIILLNT
jgi:hypothetical protein